MERCIHPPLGRATGLMTLPWAVEDEEGIGGGLRTVLVGASGLVGPFLEPDDADLGWSRLLVLNDAPDIVAEALRSMKEAEATCVPYTVRCRPRRHQRRPGIDRGTLTPLGEQAAGRDEERWPRPDELQATMSGPRP